MTQRIKYIIYFCVLLVIFLGAGLVFGLRAVDMWLGYAKQQPVAMNAPTETPVEIVFLDIGQGDASLLLFPNGETMLIDCAKDAVVLEALGRHLKPWQRTIDHMIITNPDLDHYGGCIDVLHRFTVRHIYHSGYPKEGKMWGVFNATAEHEINTEQAKLFAISATSSFVIGDAQVHFMYPDHDMSLDAKVPGSKEKASSNNASVVTKISYGTQDVLFPGDGEVALENYLTKQYGENLDVEVLKLGHHGSGSSSIVDFLQKTTPDMVIVSAGVGNVYGHPHERVVRRAERIGARLWRTDVQGDILLTIYKDRIEVATQK